MARGKRLTGIDLLEKKISDLNEKLIVMKQLFII